eukprot:2592239-Rhodomonas_salina.2
MTSHPRQCILTMHPRHGRMHRCRCLEQPRPPLELVAGFARARTSSHGRASESTEPWYSWKYSSHSDNTRACFPSLFRKVTLHTPSQAGLSLFRWQGPGLVLCLRVVAVLASSTSTAGRR